jgi:hypothetical protein
VCTSFRLPERGPRCRDSRHCSPAHADPMERVWPDLRLLNESVSPGACERFKGIAVTDPWPTGCNSHPSPTCNGTQAMPVSDHTGQSRWHPSKLLSDSPAVTCPVRLTESADSPRITRNLNLPVFSSLLAAGPARRGPGRRPRRRCCRTPWPPALATVSVMP